MGERAEEQKDGLRERKKALTRESIEEIAFSLFRRKGFDSTTVDEIAEQALISRRTFFRYFRSKEDVLFSGERKEIRRAGRMLEERPAGESLLESLEATAGSLAEGYGEQRERRLLRLKLVSESRSLRAGYMALMAELESEVSEFVSRRLGRAPEDGDIRLLAAVLVAVYRCSVEQWTESGGREDLSAVIRGNLEKFSAGLLDV